MITIGKTKSVCPECMKVVPAIKGIGEDGIYLVKECNAHGKFQTLIWEGNAADYLSWGRENLSAETPVNPKVKEKSCPDNCGLCEEHERKGCCMILEVTKRCNMHCPVCFASAGEDREKGDIPICEIEKQYDFLMAHGGPFNIQLSGGEPTMRDDLPEIIHMGREKGFTFFQLNTNGIRLAREEGYAGKLKPEPQARQAAKPAVKLTAAEKREISSILETARGDGKVHSAQDTLPFRQMTGSRSRRRAQQRKSI